ncbi:hypothetical protein IGI04_042231 [Brassica rapa subsp. trilocularis]|uniref:Uncharacterized protein n=1 Tax=Brassica rapa subsp. trilocularis TaxID=1813537 RepID=A0ABQ7KLP4_BRACM|nr:hypothetical protein IGI04_042231 [Brassica rapa subsp. trilocularis]
MARSARGIVTAPNGQLPLSSLSHTRNDGNGKSLVAYTGASSSRSNDDYIKRSDLDALFKMLKENGNTYGYSFGASMIAYKDDHLIRELVERLLQQDVDIKETINKEVKTEERWAVWSWIVTGPNGWEDFESLTRPVTCTLNGSPLPLGDSKHPSCLLLFYISHSYALHSKLGLSCTDRLVL